MKKIDTLITILSKIYFILRSFNLTKSSCTLPENIISGREDKNEQLFLLFPNHKNGGEWMEQVQLPHESELYTIREAKTHLKISRSTLFRLRNNGKINTIIYKRSVRFLRSEIEEVRIWYSIPKGKV